MFSLLRSWAVMAPAFSRMFFFGLLAVVLAGCGGSDVSLRADRQVLLEGQVIGLQGVYQVSAEDRDGNPLAQWQTDAEGVFSIALRGKAPFHLTAHQQPGEAPLRATCDGDEQQPCLITLWTTLVEHRAGALGQDHAQVRADLAALPYLDVPVDQDPFELERLQQLPPHTFDADAVWQQLAMADGLQDWLAAMSLWLDDTSLRPAPAGLLRLAVNVVAGPGGSVTPESQQVLRSDNAVVTVQPQTGYHVASVDGCDATFDDAAGTLTVPVVTAPCDTSVAFAINQYDLIYEAGNGGSLTGVTAQTVAHGNDASPVSAVAATGYHFTAWDDGVTDNPRTDTGLAGSLAVTAEFALNQYSVSYSAGTGGSLVGNASQTIAHGSDAQSVTAAPATGYHFMQWSDGSTDNPRTDAGLTGPLSVSAQFVIQQFSLVYAADAHGSLQGETSQTVDYGDQGSAVSAVPDTGYYFYEWSDGSTENPRADLNITGNLAVTASFRIYQYSLQYSAEAGGSLTGETDQTVDHGSQGAAVTAVPDEGYRFVQWSDGSTLNPRTDATVTVAVSVTAEFALKEYNLSYTTQGSGVLQGNVSQTVLHGDDGAAVTAVPAAGHDFVGWSDGSTDNPRTDLAVTDDIAVVAEFTIQQFALTYGAGAGGSLSGETAQTVDYGANGSAVTAEPETGYHFVQWSDGVTANPRTDTNVTADVAALAEFALDEFTLTYTAGTGGSLTGTTTQNVLYGGEGSPVEAHSDSHHFFIKWSDEQVMNPRVDTNVTGNLSVEAVFGIHQYVLAYTAGAGGTIVGNASQTVDSGSDGAAVEAVPDAGYQFVQWSDGVTANPRTDTNVTADVAALAEFALDEFTLTYTAGTGGSLTGTTTQNVLYGGEGSPVEAHSDSHHFFIKWSDEQVMNPRVDTNVTGNLSVEAVFGIHQYVLAYTAGAGGTIVGNASQTVDSGSDGAAVEAVPDAGYQFVQWSDGDTSNPRSDTDVTAALSVQATFAVREYTLSYDASPGGSLTGTTSQTVQHGADGTEVTAVADVGYLFVQWSDGSASNPRADTAVTADISVTAQFVLDGIELAVDEKYFAPIETGTLTLVNTDQAASEYLLVAMNLRREDTKVMLSVGLGNGTDTPAVSQLPNGTAPSLPPVYTRSQQKQDAMARRGTVGAGTPLPAGAGIPLGEPQVGDIWHMNANLMAGCDAPDVREAEVKVVGDRIVILEDKDNPPGGFPLDYGTSNSDYTEIAKIFDETVYPAVTRLLGDLPDNDDNERIVLFYTRAVNELSAPASSHFWPARYMVRDQLSQTECPASNQGEVIYMMVPDPSGVVNGNVRTVSLVMGLSGSQPAVEMASMIADHRHFEAGAASLPESWVDSGLSALSTSSVFYEASVGLEPLQRIVLSNLTTGPSASRRVAAFNTYQNPDFTNYRGWLQNPWRTGIMESGGWAIPSRGVNWAFLRYFSDRVAVSSDTPPLVSAANDVAYQLASGEASGWQTLDALAGGNANEWLRDFLLTVYLDVSSATGAVPGFQTVAPYRMASWDFDSVYGGLGGYSLNVAVLPQGQGRSAWLAGSGGAFYLRFAVEAGSSSVLHFEAPPTVGGDVQYALVRLK